MSSLNMSVREATIGTLTMAGGIFLFAYASEQLYKFLIGHTPEAVAYGMRLLLFNLGYQLLFFFVLRKVFSEAFPKLSSRLYFLWIMPGTILFIVLVVAARAML